MTLTAKNQKCKTCRKLCVRNKRGIFVCSIDCEAAFGLALAEKNKRVEAKRQLALDRLDTITRKNALKSKSDWTKYAQVEFNKYIRLRDASFSCISCGRNTRSKVNAGHYLSCGSAPHLRFNENNCHKQCEHCNTYLSGNQASYRIRLIEKIGLGNVEALESCKDLRKWTIEELKEIKTQYKLKFNELSKDKK